MKPTETIDPPPTSSVGQPTPAAKDEVTADAEEMIVFRAECDELFRRIDKDGDGRLTKKEIKSGLAAIQAQTGLVQAAKDVWKAADTDGSKAVDPDEFFAFVQASRVETAGEVGTTEGENP